MNKLKIPLTNSPNNHLLINPVYLGGSIWEEKRDATTSILTTSRHSSVPSAPRGNIFLSNNYNRNSRTVSLEPIIKFIDFDPSPPLKSRPFPRTQDVFAKQRLLARAKNNRRASLLTQVLARKNKVTRWLHAAPSLSSLSASFRPGHNRRGDNTYNPG